MGTAADKSGVEQFKGLGIAKYVPAVILLFFICLLFYFIYLFFLTF